MPDATGPALAQFSLLERSAILPVQEVLGTGHKPVTVIGAYVSSQQQFVRHLDEKLFDLRAKGVVNLLWREVDHNQVNDSSIEAIDLSLFIVSKEFLSADYCYDNAMRQAMSRNEDGSSRVIPIVIETCDWNMAPFRALEPLVLGPEPDAMSEIVRALRAIILEIRTSRAPHLLSTTDALDELLQITSGTIHLGNAAGIAWRFSREGHFLTLRNLVNRQSTTSVVFASGDTISTTCLHWHYSRDVEIDFAILSPSQRGSFGATLAMSFTREITGEVWVCGNGRSLQVRKALSARVDHSSRNWTENWIFETADTDPSWSQYVGAPVYNPSLKAVIGLVVHPPTKLSIIDETAESQRLISLKALQAEDKIEQYRDQSRKWSPQEKRDREKKAHIRQQEISKLGKVRTRQAYCVRVLPLYRIVDSWASFQDLIPQSEDRLEGVPRPPRHFAPRRNDVNNIRAIILNAITAASGTPMVAICGMGGIGKSVLAASVARDNVILSQFRDGIFWLSVGRRPQVEDLLAKLLKRLGDGRPIADIQQGRNRLRNLAASKALLLILDDVWDSDVISSFDVFEKGACLLFTTRDASIATTQGAEEYEVDLFDVVQACQLLAEWSGEPSDHSPSEMIAVAKECEYLPLALAVCGAMNRDGYPWEAILSSLKNADIEFLNKSLPESEYGHHNIMRSLKASLEHLRKDDPVAANYYEQLAALPKDVEIPRRAIEMIWQHNSNLSDLKVYGIVSTLLRKALIRIQGRYPNERISVHALLHDLLVAEWRAKEGACENPHERVLAAYRAQATDGWKSVADDGYFFQNIAWHLWASGREVELRVLLLDPDWLIAKLSAADVANLLNDFEFVTDHALSHVEAAIRLSSRALAEGPMQLVSQLIGRLRRNHSAEIDSLLDALSRTSISGCFIPLSCSLTEPGGALKMTLFKNDFGITSLCVIDESQVVAGTQNGMLRFWNLKDGTVRHTQRAHDGLISSVVVTPDRKWLVSGGVDGIVRVWDLVSGERIAESSEHAGGIESVALSDDGSMGVSGYYNEPIRVWRLPDVSVQFHLVGHAGGVNALLLCCDGNRLFSGSTDGRIIAWDLNSRREEFTLTGDKSSVNSLAMTSGGDLVSGSGDGRVSVWSTGNRSFRFSVQAHDGGVNAVAMTDDGLAVSGGLDNKVRVWDLESRMERYVFRGHCARVNAVGLLPNSRTIVSGSLDGTLKVWDLESKGIGAGTTSQHTKRITALSIVAKHHKVVSASNDGEVRLWCSQTGRLEKVLEGCRSGVHTITSVDEGLVAFGCDDGVIQLFHIEECRLTPLCRHSSRVTGTKFSSDGRVLASASRDGTLRLWDPINATQLDEISLNRGWINYLEVLDGLEIVAAGDRISPILWLPNGRNLELFGHSDRVTSMSRVGIGGELHIVTGSRDGEVIVWSPKSGEIVVRWSEGIEVTAIEGFGENYCLVGTRSGRVSLREIPTARNLWTVQGHGDRVNGIKVRFKDLVALSISSDYTAKAWMPFEKRLTATFHGDSGLSACVITDSCCVVGEDSGLLHFLELTTGT